MSGVGALALGALRPADTRAAAAQGRGSPRGGVRRPRCRTRRCWRRFRPISTARRSRARAIEKVHARLRIVGRDPGRADAGAAGAPRSHKLLSPHRGRQGAARVHAGTIVTSGAERDVGHWLCAVRAAWRSRGVRAPRRCAVESWSRATGRTSLWRPRRRQRYEGWRCGWTNGSTVPVRPLSQPDPVLGHAAQLRLCRGTGNERRGGAVESHRSRSKRSTGASSRTSRRYAPQ